MTDDAAPDKVAKALRIHCTNMGKKYRKPVSRHPMDRFVVRIKRKKDGQVLYREGNVVYVWINDVVCKRMKGKVRLLVTFSPRYRALDVQIVRPDTDPPRNAGPLAQILGEGQPVSACFHASDMRITLRHESARCLKKSLSGIRKWIRRKERNPKNRRLTRLVMPAPLFKTFLTYLPREITGQRGKACELRSGGMPRDVRRLVRDRINRCLDRLLEEVVDDEELTLVVQRWRGFQKKAFGRTIET